MKNKPLKPALLGLLFASGLALVAIPVTAQAQPNPADPSVVPPPMKPDNRLTTNISGKVTAKTDNTLTVDNRTVTLTGATTYSKSGASIGSGDVKVGDTINIVTTDDGQVAVSVNVLVSS
jgi:hypothetical protein